MKKPVQAMSDVVRVGKALSDPQRLRILMLLLAGERCVCQITEVLRLAPSTVSKHLAVLVDAGLLVPRKEHRWMYYRWVAGRQAEWVGAIRRWVTGQLAQDPAVIKDARALVRVGACPPEQLVKQQRERRRTNG